MTETAQHDQRSLEGREEYQHLARSSRGGEVQEVLVVEQFIECGKLSYVRWGG